MVKVQSYWRNKPVQQHASLKHRFSEAFFPEGYPDSVTSDYLRYQIFDTLQALASSLIGALSVAGMLKASGVGDAEASALSGTMAWISKRPFFIFLFCFFLFLL
jgi:hypothetical protein